MPTYQSIPQFEHGLAESTGILLVNLGTPDAPTAGAVRRFLKQFLWDPRVVEYPRWLWWLILNGIILRIRPSRSAAAYREIWTDDGSPLMIYSTAIARALQDQLDAHLGKTTAVELAMSYGDPSIGDAVDRLVARGARRLLVLPLYPQYSGTTTGSVFDAVTAELNQRRWVPEFRFINHYHDRDEYVDALAGSIRDYWAKEGRGEKLMFSFHGVPKQTLLDGDPYHCHCLKTARLVTDRLGLAQDEWVLSFQSRVGRAEWLRPYTDETIEELGSAGLGKLDVVCPGFSVDCLETLEEIAMQNAELFEESGGGELRYIPCLNDRPDHVALLADLVAQHAQGWPEFSGALDEAAIRDAHEQSRALAAAAGAEQ